MSEPTIISQSVEQVPVPESVQLLEPIPISLEQPPAPTTTASFQTSVRILTYPLVKETVELVQSIPGVKSFEDSKNALLAPIGTYIHSQAMLKPIVDTIDSVGQNTLNAVDQVVPSLKTATYASVGDLIMSPILQMEETKKQAINWTEEAVDRNMISPTRKMVHDIRTYYNKHLYNTNGKPLLRGSLDPVMRPVNGWVESLADKTLPPRSVPFKCECNTEIEKNFWLTKDVTIRAVPVIIDKKVEIVLMPYTYSAHVIKVFKENLEKEQQAGWMSPVKASYSSSVELVSEAWSTTMKMVGFNGQTNVTPVVVEDQAIDQDASVEVSSSVVVEEEPAPIAIQV